MTSCCDTEGDFTSTLHSGGVTGGVSKGSSTTDAAMTCICQVEKLKAEAHATTSREIGNSQPSRKAYELRRRPPPYKVSRRHHQEAWAMLVAIPPLRSGGLRWPGQIVHFPPPPSPHASTPRTLLFCGEWTLFQGVNNAFPNFLPSLGCSERSRPIYFH